MSKPTATTPPVDAALWIEDRQRRGEHVVARTMNGYGLVHPGCNGPCEFTGLPATAPNPMYVAKIEDGAIVPDHRAHWEDVVEHERLAP